MLTFKRKILLSKISHLEKKENLAELDKFISFEERNLVKRVDDFQDNIRMVHTNFERFKRNTRYLEHELEKTEGRRLALGRALGEVNDRIGMKESDIKSVRDRIAELTIYKVFTGQVAEFYGAVAEPPRRKPEPKVEAKTPASSRERERSARRVPSSCRYLEKKGERKAGFRSPMSMNEVQGEGSAQKKVFMTEEARRGGGPLSRIKGSVLANLDLFVDGFETLEDRNFLLYEGVNIQEQDMEELIRQLSLPTTEAEHYLESLKAAQQKLREEEKELERVKADRIAKIEKVMNPCHSLKGFSGPGSTPENQVRVQIPACPAPPGSRMLRRTVSLKVKDHDDPMHRKIRGTLTKLGVKIDSEADTFELLKALELIFESLRIRSEIILSQNKTLHARLSKDYNAALKNAAMQEREARYDLRADQRSEVGLKSQTLTERIRSVRVHKAHSHGTFRIKRPKISENEQQKLEDDTYFT